jgi:hypothetical protein
MNRARANWANTSTDAATTHAPARLMELENIPLF